LVDRGAEASPDGGTMRTVPCSRSSSRRPPPATGWRAGPSPPTRASATRPSPRSSARSV